MKEKKRNAMDFRKKSQNKIQFNSIQFNSIELVPDGLAVSRRRTRPTFVNIQRSVGLRERIVALRRGGANNGAKHFEVDHDGHNFAAAPRFHQLLVDRLIAPTLL
jgi:hypothetical protein